MPWSGSGTFSRTNGTFSGAEVWQNDKAAGTKIVTTNHDTHDQDLAAGINNCVAKDGQNAATADLPMGTFRHTGVGNAAARTNYGVVGQIQDGAYSFVAAANVGGSADAITLTPAPAITAYTAGQAFSFVAEAANTGAATVNVAALGAKAITKAGAVALSAGDIADGQLLSIQYDGTQFQLLSTPGVDIGAGILTGDNVFTGANTFSGTLDVTGSLLHNGNPAINIGEGRVYFGSSAPTGWLFCDGAAVSRTTYSALFAVVGTTYGAGDGSTTFNVPNLKGRFPIGVGQGATAEGGGNGTNRTLAASGGTETHTQTTEEIAGHRHLNVVGTTVNPTSVVLTPNRSITSAGDTGGSSSYILGGSTLEPTLARTSSTGGNSAMAIMNPFLAVNFMIYSGV